MECLATWRFESRGRGQEPEKDRSRHRQASRTDGDCRLQYRPDMREREAIGNVIVAAANIDRTQTKTADQTNPIQMSHVITKATNIRED